MLALNSRYWIPVIIMATTAPALAQVANFDSLTLALGFDKSTAVVTGHTGGSYSLSSIANRDRTNKPCIGYGDPNPDHILILESDFPKLKLKVDSRGKDTTLVIRGPNSNIIRCSFGTTDNPDAQVEDTNWQAGNYEIWVGSIEPSQRWNYSLSAQQ
ncbi:MAG: hypothetical protein ACRDEA_05075 [Microcystaceae cyanobacterium]